MNEIKKCTKKIRDFYIENIKSNLIAMNKNVQIKHQLDMVLTGEKEINEIINMFSITNKDKLFFDKNYTLLIDNFNKITKNYCDNVNNLKTELKKIEYILATKYSNEIELLFTSPNNDEMNVKNKNFLELIQINNFIQQFNEM
jgi:hypothetical protein